MGSGMYIPHDAHACTHVSESVETFRSSLKLFIAVIATSNARGGHITAENDRERAHERHAILVNSFQT